MYAIPKVITTLCGTTIYSANKTAAINKGRLSKLFCCAAFARAAKPVVLAKNALGF